MSKKLLLADDSITIQKVVGITFANEDYDLTIVDNGDVALEKARSVRPDLILADVFMPGKNGYELTAAVKQDPSLREVPILLLSGTFEPFDEDKARNSGADGWISKPFESQTLIDRVEELLAQAPQPDQPVEEQLEPAAMTATAPEEATDDWGEAFDLGEEEGVPTDEDLWGSVSFAEEDLAVESEGTQGGGFVFEEDSLELEEEISNGISATAAEEEDFLFEEEPFGSAEETALEEAFADKTFAPVEQEEPFVFEEELLDAGEEPLRELSAAVAEEEEYLFEEDPIEEMEETPSGEDLLTEPFAPSAKVEPLIFSEEEPAAESSDSLWEEPEEEILTLDEADILEEEELGAEKAPEPEEVLAPEEDVWGWEEAAETLETAPAEDILGEPEPSAEIQKEAEEDFSFVEEGPEWGISGEVGLGDEEPFAPLEEEPVLAPPIPVPEDAPVPAAPLAVEAQVRRLSEEELAEVVEKVAGAVIERLANTVLEKIAWEVVPDLAESMIKEELRQLKEETGTGS